MSNSSDAPIEKVYRIINDDNMIFGDLQCSVTYYFVIENVVMPHCFVDLHLISKSYLMNIVLISNQSTAFNNH